MQYCPVKLISLEEMSVRLRMVEIEIIFGTIVGVTGSSHGLYSKSISAH